MTGMKEMLFFLSCENEFHRETEQSDYYNLNYNN